MLYTTITIKENEYKLRLNARACVELERKLGTNPLNVLASMANQEGQMKLPSLETLILIFHAALQAYNHNMTLDFAYELYDDFISEGHTMLDFIPVIVDIFKSSGFIPEEATKNA